MGNTTTDLQKKRTKNKLDNTGTPSQKPYQKFSLRTFLETADAWGVFVMGSTFVLMLGSAYLVYVLQGDFEQ